eukprot:g46777.t1
MFATVSACAKSRKPSYFAGLLEAACSIGLPEAACCVGAKWLPACAGASSQLVPQDNTTLSEMTPLSDDGQTKTTLPIFIVNKLLTAGGYLSFGFPLLVYQSQLFFR